MRCTQCDSEIDTLPYIAVIRYPRPGELGWFERLLDRIIHVIKHDYYCQQCIPHQEVVRNLQGDTTD